MYNEFIEHVFGLKIYSDDIIEEVRMKNDIVDVVSQYVKLNKILRPRPVLRIRRYGGRLPRKYPRWQRKSLTHLHQCGGLL